MKRTSVAMALMLTTLLARNAHADEAPPTAQGATGPAVELSESQKAGLRFRFLAGATRRYIYGVPVTAADLEFGAGGQSHGISAYFTFNYFLGATAFGLLSQHYSPGLTFEAIFDRTRLGGGAHLSLERITRATNGNAMAALGIGAQVSVSYDIVDFDGGTLLVLGRFSGASLSSEGDTKGAIMWGPSAYLGIRF